MPARADLGGLLEKRGIAAQDRGLQLDEVRARLQAELLQQRAPCAVVRRHRILGPACAVKGEHHLRVEVLPCRVLGDELLELGHELRRPPGLELRVDPQLDGLHALLLELEHEVPDARLPVEIGKRSAAPERQRIAKGVRGTARVAAGERPSRVRDERPEHEEVDFVRIGPQQVRARTGLDPRGVADPAAQPRDVHLDGMARRRRRIVGPERVDEELHGNRLVRAKREQSKQRPLLGRAEGDQRAVHGGLERSEHPQLDAPEARRRSCLSLTYRSHRRA